MKVLWITNIIFPAACEKMGLPSPVYGGWMFSSMMELKQKRQDVELAVATTYRGSDMKILIKDSVTYYLLPTKTDNTKYNRALEPLWRQIKKEFGPDVVHIHGTEYAHGLAYIKACGAENVCISIQGLVSVIARYYYAGMTTCDIIKNLTLRDLVRSDTIFQQKRKFQKRGEIEKAYLESVSHIIGRTTWDKAHAWAINPLAHYHVCNEIMRPSFYQYRWNYENCDKYSIFLSQAGYPIKGLHKVLEAMPLILKEYPDACIRVAGDDIIHKPFYRITGYGKYLRSLAKKLQIEDKVTFLGTLTEEQMCKEYMKANLFICPSAIENSPNSLGEAQLLGVPHLAADVGGVMDMMKGNEDGVYRFEEVDVLAHKVCSVFYAGSSCGHDGADAMRRHDREVNVISLTEVYRSMGENKIR